VLGYHDAYYRYTVGQRRGLRVALGFPAYVLRVEAETRRVVVAAGDRLLHPGLLADRCTWLHRPDPDQVHGVRIRHRGAVLPATLHDLGDDVVQVQFHEPAHAISPGQAAVFYDGDRVLGGGWIVRPTEG
jgi:tRNA-specific 2-thiouridylase